MKRPPRQAAFRVGLNRWLCAKGRTAATSPRCARVVEFEARAMQPLDEVERDTRDVGKRNLIDEDAHVIEIRDPIAILLGVEIELILEAGASAAGHRDAQALLGAEAFLRAHLADHLNRFWRQDDIRKRRVFLGSTLLDRSLIIVHFFGHV